jgi:hypothetical protein
MKIYRIAAVLLAVTMAAGMLTACGEPEYEEGTTESETRATVQTEDVTDTQPATETVEEVVTEPAVPTASSIGLTFTLNSNGKGYTCTGIGTCTDTDIVLDTYNGLPVTAIGYEAFRGCSQMTSISLPSTVNQIEQGAFWDCTGLTSVVIPKRVTELSIQLFEGCTSLTSLTLPKNLKVIRIEALYNTRLMNIYFEGTEAQWAAVTVEEANHELDFATVHYEYKD